MRNVLSSIMLTALIGTFGVANENASSNNGTGNKGAGVFVGLEGGASVALTKATMTTKTALGNSKASIKDNIGGGNIGLKVGYYLNPNSRIYAGYYFDYLGNLKGTLRQSYGTAGNSGETDLSTKYNIHKLALGYDYLPAITDDIKLILGGYLGYGVVRGHINILEIRQIASSGTNSGTMQASPNKFVDTYSSLFLGLNVGYLQEFGKYGNLEFGGRFEYLNIFSNSRTFSVISAGNKSISSTQKAKAYALSASFYVGYSYKF